MTITGAGLCPAGLSPAGLGTPEASTALSGYSTSSTGAVSSVLYDANTGDPVLDNYGQEMPMSDVGQRVAFCLRILRGSRMSFQDFGRKMPAKVTDNVQSEVAEAIRYAMLPVTSDGSATILSTEVKQDPTRATQVLAIVRWRDNRNKTAYNNSVVL